MNRTKKELYEQVDEAMKKIATLVPIEDVCIKAVSLMQDAHIAQFLKIKLSLQFLISSKTPLEGKIKDLKSIKAELEEKNKVTMMDMAKMRKTLDDIEKNNTKEIKDLNWAIDKLIEGMSKKIEKNKSEDKQDE